MRKIGFVISLILSLALTWVLNTKLGQTPPMGKFLNPFNGFWQNAEEVGGTFLIEDKIEGVNEEVKIVFDDNMVPHIFAENNEDLSFAHGYVTAMLRLWQMDFQSRYAEGRLCEIVGDKAIDLDKFQRKIGMKWAAEKSLEYSMQDETIANLLTSYAAGVNYYIDNLSSKKIPFEYKLLDYQPEPWTTLKSQLLLSYMSWDLSGYNTDLRLTNVLNEYGADVVKELFTSESIKMDPIIPPGTNYDFEPVEIPKKPEIDYSKTFAPKEYKKTAVEMPDPNNGSNNWAIAGSRSKSGMPILSSDMHLNLSLPSLWMQVQMTSPDVNVYGVSLQGAPVIIVGFNEDVAWGPTNVDPDIMDWYSIKFKDTTMNEYFHEGRWKNTFSRKEIIKVRGGDDVIEDVIHTHHGPVVFRPGEKSSNSTLPSGCAMKWLTHEPSNPFKAFYMLNRAKNYDDYVSAIRYFEVPAQNFCFIDNSKNIALWTNGNFPLKWEGQGQFILDGTNSKHDWARSIPHDQNPHIKNPERGFVSSANQDVTDTLYPYYLNWEFTTFERGERINDLLRKLENAEISDLQDIQNDFYNKQAELAVPRFLELVAKDNLANEIQKKAYSLLKNWDYQGAPESLAASIYDQFWEEFRLELWQDEFGSGPIKLYPDNTRSLELLLDTTNRRWVDNIKTAERENISEMVLKSFISAVDKLADEYGSDISLWQWAKIKGLYIRHLARIPELSSDELWVGGGHNMVNASHNSKFKNSPNGPSWRMIVEVGEKPKAYGVYPGGQSGNPGSPYYDNMVDDWASGNLRELNFIYRSDELNDKMLGSIIINKK